jgi:hypothetical protein
MATTGKAIHDHPASPCPDDVKSLATLIGIIGVIGDGDAAMAHVTAMIIASTSRDPEFPCDLHHRADQLHAL